MYTCRDNMTCHCKKCRRDKLEAEFTDDKGKQFKTCNACREKRRKPKSELKRPNITLEVCKSLAQQRGGECLSTGYVNTKTKMKWRCAEGHQWETTYGSIKSGRWCPHCTGHARVTIDKCNQLAEDRGGKCISMFYTNKANMKWRCAKGHVWETMYGNIKSGCWCPHCTGHARVTIDICNQLAEDRGGKCISNQYQNCDNHMLWRCADGHEWSAKWNNIKTGHWCPTCSSGRSERIVRDTLEAKTGDAWPKQRPKWLDGLELDGYCEKLGAAFEYQGKQHYEYVPHFHRGGKEDLAKQQERDRKKYEVCVKRGVKLMLIPYKFNCYDENKLKTYALDQLRALGV